MSSRRVDSNIFDFLHFEMQVFLLSCNSYDRIHFSDCLYKLVNRKAPSTANNVIIQHYNTSTRNDTAQLTPALLDGYET